MAWHTKLLQRNGGTETCPGCSKWTEINPSRGASVIRTYVRHSQIFIQRTPRVRSWEYLSGIAGPELPCDRIGARTVGEDTSSGQSVTGMEAPVNGFHDTHSVKIACG